jgi:hypothetical protein
MNHVKKNCQKTNENEREMNGQKLITQCAQNVKNLSFFGKQISRLFGLFLASNAGTLYKLTSFPYSFCSNGTNIFVIQIYKLDVTQVSKTFVNQVEKLKCNVTRVIKKV